MKFTHSGAKECYLRNLPQIRRAQAVKELRGAFPGELAVVAGAGPSLDAALPELREFRERLGLLIAVDRALPLLMDHGIEPSFVVTQDNSGQDILRTSFRQVPRAALVFHQAADPSFVGRWKGFLFTASLDGGRQGLGSLEWGPHVGHAATALALFMGCRPVVLVGVDLAFGIDATHAGGETDPLCRRETWIDAVGGGQVQTDEAFAACVEPLEELIRERRGRVIQTSPFGARLRGAAELSLAQALKT